MFALRRALGLAYMADGICLCVSGKTPRLGLKTARRIAVERGLESSKEAS